MAIFSSVQAYRQHQLRVSSKLKLQKTKTPVKAAMFVASRARAYAPFKSGKLRKGIQRKGSTVIARASNNGFPYIHWVNQTRGTNMTTLHVKPKGQSQKPTVNIHGSWIIVPGGIMKYGSRPSSWKWTGKPGFFKRAVFEGRKYFKDITLSNTRKALRGVSV
jgi:hypothetical protein